MPGGDPGSTAVRVGVVESFGEDLCSMDEKPAGRLLAGLGAIARRPRPGAIWR